MIYIMIPRWSFNNDTLFDLVVAQRKHGTCSLYTGNDDLAHVGDVNIIYNSKNQEIKIKITNVRLCRFCDVDAKWAEIEGEGDLSLDYWRRVHQEFFTQGNPNFNPTDMLELDEFILVN